MTLDEIKQIIDIPGTRDTNQLEILRKSWTLASEPDSEHSFKNKINNFVWYNPFGQVHISDIYPNVELNPNVPNRVNVLSLELHPLKWRLNQYEACPCHLAP